MTTVFQMTDEFDGYRKWLGISNKNRLPSHYELLAISLDEDDPEVIRAAIEQRRHFVESKRGDGHDSVVTEILYRIGEAETTLLNSEMRRDYDRQLNLFEKRRKNRQVDPFAPRSRVKSRPGPTVGEDHGILNTFAGIVAIVCVAFGIMAWFSFQLPWTKIEKQAEPAPVVRGPVELPAQHPRSHNTLVAVNDKSVAESPKKLEERQPRHEPLGFTTPELDEWAKDVVAMPADKQIEAVSKKLQEMNAGFDGKETHTIKNGVVTEFTFITDRVSDISPVRALAGLKSLNCTGSDVGRGILADLSPLKGMRLTNLQCYSNQIKDLSPLRDMLLTHFTCSYSPVSDITPLIGMPLSSLNLGRTSVSDLSPLRGCPLVELNIAATPVSSISPLQGMPLQQLYSEDTNISDLSPLIGLPLSVLNVSKSPVSTFSALRHLPLTYLKLDFKPERDADILRSIKTLQIINDKPSAEFWKEVEGKRL